jgi:Na+-translocating ferredoxin:NAD+ oxidoreductase RnfE subunit
MSNYFDTGTLIVITITFVLFTIALFTKGFTHDLFLEAGIFLISVKLIIMGYKNSIINNKLLKKLDEIKKSLREK